MSSVISSASQSSVFRGSASSTANVIAATPISSPYFSSQYATHTVNGHNASILLCSTLPASVSAPTSYGCWVQPAKSSGSKNYGMSAGMWAMVLLVGGTAATAVAGLA
ncbi:hypothetical protein JCM33374_g2460 [Metschnikowia sp. JCM 33374]|nr:hypothetical protein JCM33374_g2460 [Metschnikowia sp. JCM 33374]